VGPSLPLAIAIGQRPTGLFVIATAQERVLGSLPAFLATGVDTDVPLAPISIVAQAIASPISHSLRAGPLRSDNQAWRAKPPNGAIKPTGRPAYADTASPFKRL